MWKKSKGTTLFFENKKTQNGISRGKIDFLNNSDKTWCSTVNSKMLRIFLKTHILISKMVLYKWWNSCVAVVIRGKSLKWLCSVGDFWHNFGWGGRGCPTNNYSTLLEALCRSSSGILQVMMLLEDSDEIGIKLCLCLPKAQLNSKNSTKRRRKASFDWVFVQLD